MLVILAVAVGGGVTRAQSGHSSFKGYVAFEGIAYVDKQPRAKVELLKTADSKQASASAETDEHGMYDLQFASLGEAVLRISAPGYKTYQIDVYLPSDFTGNLAVLLKKEDAGTPATKK
jgi:hypothetical protein